MSAAFKLAKKKYTQQDLRRIMHETKANNNRVLQDSASKKIDSPLAKYNEAGQLTCVICSSVVRSEAVWKVHVNSKQHKENIEQAKRLKEKVVHTAVQPQSTTSFAQTTTSALKRPPSPAPRDSISNKKIKGILKNSTSEQIQSLPDDFFDSSSKINRDLVNIRLPTNKSAVTSQDQTEAASQEQPPEEEKIPEGFFDDPKADAKARNIEYKNPNDEEWERFQKEIKEATTESLAIINEEQEESTAERQISEIDEQIRNWSRVLSLEKKKEEVRQRTLTALEAGERAVRIKKEEAEESEEDEEANDAEFDEFLDWRAKKSFK